MVHTSVVPGPPAAASPGNELQVLRPHPRPMVRKVGDGACSLYFNKH